MKFKLPKTMYRPSKRYTLYAPFRLASTMNHQSFVVLYLTSVFCILSSVLRSTTVENVRQIRLFLQNKPNFLHFSTENASLTQKQTQFKANSNPILAQKSGWQSQTNPTKANFRKADNERFCVEQEL